MSRTNIPRIQRLSLGDAHHTVTQLREHLRAEKDKMEAVCELEQDQSDVALCGLGQKLRHEKQSDRDCFKYNILKRPEAELQKVLRMKDLEIHYLKSELRKQKCSSRGASKHHLKTDDQSNEQTKSTLTFQVISSSMEFCKTDERKSHKRCCTETKKPEQDQLKKTSKQAKGLPGKERLPSHLEMDGEVTSPTSEVDMDNRRHGVLSESAQLSGAQNQSVGDIGGSMTDGTNFSLLQQHKMTEKIASLESMVTDMKCHIQKLEKNNTALVGDKENLLKRIKEMERRQRPLQDKNKRFLEKNMELTAINKSLEEKIQKLTEEAKKLKHKTEQSKRRADQLRQQQETDHHHSDTVVSLMDEVDELKQTRNEQLKTINALRQACLEKDRRVDILQQHRRRRATRAQQRAAGIRETSFGFDEDTHSIDSDMSTCSLSLDMQTDDESHWEEFAKEEFEVNYHRLAKEHVALERSYALLQSDVGSSVDPERQTKMVAQLQIDLETTRSKVKDLETILESKGQSKTILRSIGTQVKLVDTSWVEDKSKLNAANKVLLNKIASLEDAELKLRHELMDCEEQNEVLEFRCLELEQKYDKVVEDLKCSPPAVPPGVITQDCMLQLALVDASLVSVGLEEMKGNLHSLKYSKDHNFTSDELNTLMVTISALDAADQKIRECLAHEALSKEKLIVVEKEKAELLSAATGVSPDIVLEFEVTRNKLLEYQQQVTKLETEVSSLRQSEAVYKYTKEFNEKTEARYKHELDELKRRLDSTLKGQSYESTFVDVKMDELKKSEQTVHDLENTIQQLTEKMEHLQRENGELTEQLSNHQEEQSLAESDRHTITMVQSLQAQVDEHERSESELTEKNIQLESQLAAMQKRIEQFEENELDLLEKNYSLEAEVNLLNNNVTTMRLENEKIHQQYTESTEKLRRHSFSLEQKEEEILDKNSELENDLAMLREKLRLREDELEHYKFVESDVAQKASVISELETQNDGLMAEVLNLRTHVEQLTQIKDGDSGENEITSLRQQVDKLLVSELSVKERVGELELSERMLKEQLNSVVERAEGRERELQGEISKLHKVEHSMKESLAEKEMVEQALEEKVKNLAMTEAKTQEENARLVESEAKLKEKLLSYKSLDKDLMEVEHTKLMLVALEATKEQLQKRIDELEIEKAQGEDVKNNLSQNIKKKEEKEEILKSQVECLEQKVRFLESLNEEFQEEHPERTVGSLKRQISDFGHETDKLAQTLDEKTLKIEHLQEDLAAMKENELKLTETIHELEENEAELKRGLKFYEDHGGDDVGQVSILRIKVNELEAAELSFIEKIEECSIREKEHLEHIESLEKQIADFKCDNKEQSIQMPDIVALQDQIKSLEANEERLISRIYELEQSEQELTEQLSHYDDDELLESQSSMRLQELELSDFSLRESIRELENDKCEQAKNLQALEHKLRADLETVERERDLVKNQLEESEKVSERKIKHLSDKVDILLDSEGKLMDKIADLESVEMQLRSELESKHTVSSKSLQDEIEQQASMEELQSTNILLNEEITRLKVGKDLSNACQKCAELETMKEKVGILIDTEQKLMDRLEQIESVEHQLRATIAKYEISQKESESVILNYKKETEIYEQEKQNARDTILALEKSEHELMEKCSKHEHAQKHLQDKVNSQHLVLLKVCDRLELEEVDEDDEVLGGKISELFEAQRSLINELQAKYSSCTNSDRVTELEEHLRTEKEKFAQAQTDFLDKTKSLWEQIAVLQMRLDKTSTSAAEAVNEDSNFPEKKTQEMEVSVNAFNEKTSELEKQLLDLRENLDHSRTELSDKVIENAKLQETICTLQETIGELNVKVETQLVQMEAVQVVSESDEEMQKLLQKIDNLEKNELDYKKQIRGLRSQVDLFESELAERKVLNANSELTQRTKEWDFKENTFKNTINDLEEEVNGLKMRQQKLVEERDDYKMRVEELESQFEELDTELNCSDFEETNDLELSADSTAIVVNANTGVDANTLQKRNDELESQLKAKDSELAETSALKKEMKELQSHLELKSAELSDIQRKWERAEDHVKELTSELSVAKAQLVESEKISRDTVSSMNNELIQLKADAVSCENVIKKLESNLSLSNAEVDRLQTELKSTMPKADQMIEKQVTTPTRNEVISENVEPLSSHVESAPPISPASVAAGHTTTSVQNLSTLTQTELVEKVEEMSNVELISQKKISELDKHLACFREAIELLVHFMESEGHDMGDFRRASHAFDQNFDYDDKLRSIVKSEATLKEKLRLLEFKDRANRSAMLTTEKEFREYIDQLETELYEVQRRHRFRDHAGDTGKESSEVDKLLERILELEGSEKRLQSQLKVSEDTETVLQQRLAEVTKSGGTVQDFSTSALRDLEQAHREKVEEHLTRIQELEHSEKLLQEKLDELKQYHYEELVERIGTLERTERALQRKIEILETQEREQSRLTDAMLDGPEDILRQQMIEMEKMEKHLRHQISDLEHDREELHEIARKDKSTIHDLNVKIRELMLAEKILQEQVDRFELTEESLYSQVDSLQDRVDELEETLNELAASERALQAQVKEYKFKEDSVKRRTNSLESEIEEIRLSELSLKKKNAELGREKESLKQRIDAMHRQLSELDGQEAELRKKIHVKETSEVNLRSQVNKMNAAAGVAKQRISDLELTNDRQGKKIVNLENEKIRLKSELSDYEIKIAELQSKISRLLDAEIRYKKQIQDLENSEFDLQKEIQDLKFGHHDVLSRSQEIERSELRLQEKIATLERNEHKLKLRIQELEASAFMVENKALTQTELENENKLLHRQVKDTSSKVSYLEQHSKGLAERLSLYEFCNRDDLALVPRAELSALHAQIDLLREHEQHIERLEKSEVNLQETIRKLRQGLSVCGHEWEIAELKNQLNKHNLILKEKATLKVNYEQQKIQLQELRRQLEATQCSPLHTLSPSSHATGNKGTSASTSKSTKYTSAINEFAELLQQHSDETPLADNTDGGPPSVEEETVMQVRVPRSEMHVPLFGDRIESQSPSSSGSLKTNVSSNHPSTSPCDSGLPPKESALWQAVEERKPTTNINFNASLWDSIEQMPPGGKNRKSPMVQFVTAVNDEMDSESDSDSVAPPLPGSAPPALPKSAPPSILKHQHINHSNDDDSYFLPSSIQDGADSADDVSDLQDGDESAPPLPKSPAPDSVTFQYSSPEEDKQVKKPVSIGRKIPVPSWLMEDHDDNGSGGFKKEMPVASENIGISFATEVGLSMQPDGKKTAAMLSKTTPSDSDTVYIHSKAAETERGYKSKITELERQIKSLETQLKIVRMGNRVNTQVPETNSPGDMFSLKVKVKEKEHQVELQEKTIKELRQEVSRLQLKVREKEEQIRLQGVTKQESPSQSKSPVAPIVFNRVISPWKENVSSGDMGVDHWKSTCEKREKELVAKNNELERMQQELRRWQDEARDAESRRAENVTSTGDMEMENRRLKDIDNLYVKLCRQHEQLKDEHASLVETHKLCESLEEDKHQLEQTIDSMKSQVEGYEKLENDKTLLEKEVRHLLKDVEKKTKSEEALFRDNIHLKRDVDKFTKELSRLEKVEKDCKLVKSRYNEMERVMHKAQTAVSPLRSRVVSLLQKCKQRDELIKLLTSEMSSCANHPSSNTMQQAQRLIVTMPSEEYHRPLSPLTPVSPEGAATSLSRSWLKRLKSRFRRSKKSDEMSDVSTTSYRSLDDLDDFQEDDSRPSSGSSRLRSAHSDSGLHHRRVRSDGVLSTRHPRTMAHLNNVSLAGEYPGQQHITPLVPRILNGRETNTYRVIADYNPEHFSRSGHRHLELSLKEGEIVTVLGAVDAQGYYEGEANGRIGLVPANYLQPVHTSLTVESVAARRLRHLQSLEHVDGMPEQILHTESLLHSPARPTMPYRPGEHDRVGENLGQMVQSLALGQHSNQVYGGGIDPAVVSMPCPVVLPAVPGHVRSFPHLSGHQALYGHTPSRVPHHSTAYTSSHQPSDPRGNEGSSGPLVTDSTPTSQVPRQQQGLPDVPRNFRLEKVLADRSVLLSWELPEMDDLGRSNMSVVSGYKIFVNGREKHEVKSAYLRKVLLEKLDLHRPQHFSIQTVAQNGHVSSMVDFLFDEMIAEPSGDSGTVTESSDVEHEASSVTSNGVYARGEKKLFIALYDYNPMEHSPNAYPAFELPFHAGDLIKTSGPMRADGFYHGEIHGRRGLVPASFIEEVAISLPPKRGPTSKAHSAGSTTSVNRQSSQASSSQASVRPKESRHRLSREKRKNKIKEVQL